MCCFYDFAKLLTDLSIDNPEITRQPDLEWPGCPEKFQSAVLIESIGKHGVVFHHVVDT